MRQPPKLFLPWLLQLARARLAKPLITCLFISPLLLATAANSTTNWLSLAELLKKWETVPLSEIQRLAEGGDGSAQHYLGYCHAEGLRMPQTPTEGASWYRRALQGGYLPSANNLGLLYQRGLLGTNDFVKAAEWYRFAAERGLPQSQMNMGVLYREGTGVTADFKEALRWFRLAASQGHPEAMVEVGRAYRFGRGVEVDSAEAIRWFEKAANEKDSSLANLNLGLFYEDNHDRRRAIPFYERAANAGRSDAMVRLYFCYGEAEDAPRDRAKAIEWLTKAADARSAHAECLMGDRCQSVEWVGEGEERRLTRPDLQGALRWFRRSAAQGWAGGQYYLGLMYLEGKGVEVDESQGLELIRAAADQNHRLALRQLASLYACGIGEPRNDNDRPVPLLERSGGWEDLVLRYEHGLGAERDLVTAARCYSKMVIHDPYSRRDLSDMIQFKPATGASLGTRIIDPLDRHLKIVGPPQRSDTDASEVVSRVLSLYLKSARGDREAAFQMGEFYEKGRSAPKSAPFAWSWFSVAAQNGNAAARDKNRMLEKHMSADELKSAQKHFADILADLREVATALR